MAVLIGDDHKSRFQRQDFDEQLARAEKFKQCALEQFTTNLAATAIALDLAASVLRGLAGQLRRNAS